MESLVIDEEFQNLVPELTPDEQVRLARSIIKDGCISAIVVWQETGSIVDGHNRYKICVANDIPFTIIKKDFADRDEAKAWIINNQLSRRNLTPYDRGRLALELEDILKAQAREKQISFLQQNQGAPFKGSTVETLKERVKAELAERTDPDTVVEIFPQRDCSSGRTRDKLAAMAGVSGRTLDKIKVIDDLATDDQRAALSDGSASINKTYKEIKSQNKPTSTAETKVRTWDKDEESIREQIRHIGLELTGSANSRFITAGQLADQVDEMLAKLGDAAEALRNIEVCEE